MECASESLYSVQNIAIHRIRFIFDSTNTLVYRLGPSNDTITSKFSVSTQPQLTVLPHAYWILVCQYLVVVWLLYDFMFC